MSGTVLEFCGEFFVVCYLREPPAWARHAAESIPSQKKAVR
jgi:hypothetical protein